MKYTLSINIEHSTFDPESYIVTPNALGVVGRIIDAFTNRFFCRNYVHRAEVWSATREIESFVSCPLKTVIFPCPACCFKWHESRRRKASGVLGSPTDLLSAYGQARRGGVLHIQQYRGCPDSCVHTKGKWQIAPAW